MADELPYGAVTPADADAAFEGPAFVSNHWIVQPVGGYFRIAFLEKQDGTKPSRFRTAVAINLADLPTLVATSFRLLAQGPRKCLTTGQEYFRDLRQKAVALRAVKEPLAPVPVRDPAQVRAPSLGRVLAAVVIE